MPRASRVKKTCLVCEAIFEGTPKATRCPDCKSAGIKTNRAMSAKVIEAEAARVNTRTCKDCRKSFRTRSDAPEAGIHCPECTDLLGLHEIELVELSVEEEARLRAEARQQRRREQLKRQAAFLDHRARKPKGYKAMTNHTSRLPIGLVWQQLCAADGAAGSLLYAGANIELTEHEKLALLTSYAWIRCRGYHPTAIAKLCPKALLRKETQAAMSDLPKVTDAPLEETAGPDAIALGLT